MKRIHIAIALVTIAAVTALAVGIGGVLAQDGGDGSDDGDGTEFTYQGDITAPEFPLDADWINTSAPVRLSDLRGKIVLLDFWTYGCINCMHVIPDLKRLEAEYSDVLVVIGVHSAKFTTEGETENIRRVVQRYGVTHPVLNDRDFVTWSEYSVHAWPTFVLIDPFGKIVGQLSGEPLYPRIAPIIATMAEEYGAAGLLSTEPLPQAQPESSAETADTPLRFPGKVLADPAGDRLFIADSGHNRIVITTLDSFEVLDVVGNGNEGMTDGDFAEAQFNFPQGMELVGNTLYVADTENHAIRAVDLDARTVTTVAGTGKQGFDRLRHGPGTEIDLNSPWDLVAHGDQLYIAMAGIHQLWVYDLASGDVGPYAGSGREALTDGRLKQAGMNQPSGIDTDGERLYFADPEASAVRTASLDPDGRVETIVGTGLFDFGDRDGVGNEALLQHVQGITVADDGVLYVADTYNHKIKRIDPATRESVTLAGTGEPGLADGDAASAQFYEPGGLDYADGKLYVADTNNHAIRVVDLAGGTVRTVEFANEARLSGAADAASAESDTIAAPAELPEGAILQPAQTVGVGEGTLVINANIPEGYKLNDAAPFTAIWDDNPLVQIPADSNPYREVKPHLPVEIPANFAEGQTELVLNLTVYWCEAVNQALCFVDRSVLVVPLTVSAESDNHSVQLERELVPPSVDNTLN